MRTLIQGGYVVGFNGASHEILQGGVVVLEDDAVVFVGFAYDGPVDETIDARGKLVSPGFINTHIHPSSNTNDYFLNDPDKTDLLGANYLTFNTPGAGKKSPRGMEDFRVSAKFCIVQAIKNGSTTIVLYGGGANGGGQFVEMVGELGLRAYMAPSYRNVSFYFEDSGALRYVWDDALGEKGLQQAVDFIKEHRGAYNGRVQGMLFPRQPDTCTAELLKATRRQADQLGVPIQIHAAINMIEFHEMLMKYGKTPIGFLDSIGFLRSDVTLGHCVFLNSHSWASLPRGNDLELIAKAGASISHCPYKYAKLGIALETFDRYLEQGVNISIGTDTYPTDVIHEMRIACLASRFASGDYLAGSYAQAFNAATLGGAQVVGRADLGRLCPGAKADVAIVDLAKTEIGAVMDPIKALLEYGSGRDVETVIIDGRIVVDRGNFVGIDEAELLAAVQAESEGVWSRMQDWDFLERRADQISLPAFPLKERPDRGRETGDR